MRALVTGLVLAGMALPALAQDLPNRREALRMIFDHDADVESVVFPHPALNDAERQLLSNAVAQGLLPDMDFYGALAFAPDSGLADPNTTVAVGNFHDEASAAGAALARCNSARGGQGADCAVALIVRPAGWQEGAALQLSSGAAEALRRAFRQADRPRVFAISPATGQFGIGSDAAAANADCGAEDCRPVVADP